MREDPGGWHLQPSPAGPGKPPGSSPPADHLAIGRVQRRGGMDTVTTGSLKFPSLAAGRLKCAPMGVGWGQALSPIPQSLASVLRVGCLFLDVHAPLEQMGEPVPMGGADDIEHFGLGEDLGQPQASPDSRSGCVHLRQGRLAPLPHRGTARQWTSGW